MARLDRFPADTEREPLPPGRRGPFYRCLRAYGVRRCGLEPNPTRRRIQAEPGQRDEPGLLRNVELLRIPGYAGGAGDCANPRDSGIPTHRGRGRDAPFRRPVRRYFFMPATIDSAR